MSLFMGNLQDEIHYSQKLSELKGVNRFKKGLDRLMCVTSIMDFSKKTVRKMQVTFQSFAGLKFKELSSP